MNDFIKITNALELQKFLNSHTASVLREIYLENKATGNPIKGISVRRNMLTDGQRNH